ncbi:RNA polymerase sigma factor RpoD/SigA [Candidatus Woesearchaeota archaeon]|nr:RNA polymerase sigma factor RpoD/SigA [Candidatus Woesearchaeota archaeon]
MPMFVQRPKNSPEIYIDSSEEQIFSYLKSRVDLKTVERINFRNRYTKEDAANRLNITPAELGILLERGYVQTRRNFFSLAPLYRKVHGLEERLSSDTLIPKPKTKGRPKCELGATRSTNGEDGVDTYFGDIAGYTPLSREEEIELTRKYREGDLDARNRLVEANLRFVVSVAKEYPTNKGVSFQDLISAGNMGLLTAAERFDETKGFKFISYAVWWIRQAMLQTLAEHSNSVRKPLNQVNMISKMRKTVRGLSNHMGSIDPEDMIEELSDIMHIKETQVEETIRASKSESSLDAPVREGEDENYYNVIRDGNQESSDELVARESMEAALNRAMECLNGRELKVLS